MQKITLSTRVTEFRARKQNAKQRSGGAASREEGDAPPLLRSSAPPLLCSIPLSNLCGSGSQGSKTPDSAKYEKSTARGLLTLLFSVSPSISPSSFWQDYVGWTEKNHQGHRWTKLPGIDISDNLILQDF